MLVIQPIIFYCKNENEKSQMKMKHNKYSRSDKKRPMKSMENLCLLLTVDRTYNVSVIRLKLCFGATFHIIYFKNGDQCSFVGNFVR